MLKTYKEWNDQGYAVKAGEKACVRYENKAYFNKNQVVSTKRDDFMNLNTWAIVNGYE